MSTMTIHLSEQLYHYLQAISLREPDILKKLREETSSLPKAIMQISPEQGQFMQLLVNLMGAEKILEIGTFTGYSALAMALALPASGKLVACDIHEEWTAMAKRYWQAAGVTEKIDLRIAPAIETLDQLIAAGESNSFDFIFIDADKREYEDYYERSLSLLRVGGLMMVDNVLQGGRVIELDIQDQVTQSVRNFNEKLLKDQRVQISLLPLGDGVTLARKL